MNTITTHPQYGSSLEKMIMTSKKSFIWKSIGMLATYGVIMAVVIYVTNDCTFTKWNAVTWGLFMVYGIWSCYRWYKRKLEEEVNKEG